MKTNNFRTASIRVIFAIILFALVGAMAAMDTVSAKAEDENQKEEMEEILFDKEWLEEMSEGDVEGTSFEYTLFNSEIFNKKKEKLKKVKIYNKKIIDADWEDNYISFSPKRRGKTIVKITGSKGSVVKYKVIVAKSYYRYYLKNISLSLSSSGYLSEIGKEIRATITINGKKYRGKYHKYSYKVFNRSLKVKKKYKVTLSLGGVSVTRKARAQKTAFFGAIHMGKTKRHPFDDIGIKLYGVAQGDRVALQVNGKTYKGKVKSKHKRAKYIQKYSMFESEIDDPTGYVVIKGSFNKPPKGTKYYLTVHNRFGQKILTQRGKFSSPGFAN